VLDEEISRLPAKYRAPIVLCYLESKSHAQAARELGCPKSSLAQRLSRARQILRGNQRGITLGVGAVAAILAEQARASPLPALLTIHTVKAAVSIVAGNAAHASSLRSGS
jgi:hypothetical protein